VSGKPNGRHRNLHFDYWSNSFDVGGLFAVWHQLRPRWQPSWSELKSSLHYGVREYPGGVADFTTLRLDQLMLGAMASNVAIGLYVIAVRLSEMTTLAADAIADALMPEVAASKSANRADLLCARSLRLGDLHAFALVAPLWLAAPLILRILFGQSFCSRDRRLSVVCWWPAGVWSCGSIVINGLRGFDYPGLARWQDLLGCGGLPELGW